jgi:hypothetical protein
MHYTNKLTIIWLLSIIILLQCGFAGAAFAEDYQDHSIYPAIQEGVEQGLIDLENGDFRPDQDITRQEWVRLLIRYLGYYRLSSEGFEDVAPEDSYYEDFLIANEAGLVIGDEENRVYPEDSVSREEALHIVVRSLVGGVEEAPLILIQDGEEINPNYEAQVRYAVSAGWFPLDTDNYLEPKEKLSRAQAVELLDIATGTRLLDETNFGNALDTTVAEDNICVYSPDTMIQRTDSTHDIYVFQTAGSTLTLNKVQLDGKLVVLGAGDIRIELKNTQLALVETRNPYGTVEVVRDSRSSIGDFLQGTPLTLEVQDDTVEESTSRTPPTVRWLAIGFVFFLLGMVVYQARDRTQTLFISQGVGKYIHSEPVQSWNQVGILNPQPQIVDVSVRNGKIRIEGLKEGRAHVELYQGMGVAGEKQLDGVEHTHIRKSRRGRVFLNIVVVKRAEE